jgi:hypothetical protein
VRRLKRAAVILLKTIGVIALVLALANAGLKYMWGHRVESQLRAIKAKGQPVSLADLKGPNIPDSENAAVIYERIFKVTSELPRPTTPPRQSTPKDAMDDSSILRMAPEELAKRPDLLNAARKVIARNAKGLNLVEEAVARPMCRFPDFLRSRGQVATLEALEAGDQTAFARYANIRTLARLLSERAVVEARDGNMDKAARSIDLALKLDRSLRNETGIISFLVRIAVLRISTRSIQTVATYHPLDERQARRLFDTISTLDLGRAYERAIETERVRGLQQLEIDKRVTPGCLAYANETVYLDVMSKMADGAYLDYHDALSRGLFSPQIPLYAILPAIIAPSFTRVSASRYSLAAHLAETQAFLALQAYRDKFGSYPNTLEELKRQIGWKLPTDPFSSKDLMYKPQAKGFLLYSIGPDRKDDGGRLELKRNDLTQSPGDIVLRWSR